MPKAPVPNQPKRKPGRPHSIIDWNVVDNLLIAGCIGTEIAARLGIHAETLYLRCEQDKKIGFSAYQQQKKELGDTILRSAQFKKAASGYNTMMIWLGKQRLHQVDKTEVKQQITQEINQRVTLKLPRSGNRLQEENQE